MKTAIIDDIQTYISIFTIPHGYKIDCPYLFYANNFVTAHSSSVVHPKLWKNLTKHKLLNE